MTWAYYNELDPYCVEWLKNLIKQKLIMDGEVDNRPIQDVKPYELVSFTRCHFFAGIAGWDLALQLAGFPTDRKVWTGSCPCQPFSTAGKRLQFADERHLWPHWFHLISVNRPPTIFGEQVANGAGIWLDLVFADLESQGYAVAAALLPAAGVGAPHDRKRNWYVAHAHEARWTNTLGLSTPAARTDIRAAACVESGDAPAYTNGKRKYAGTVDAKVAATSKLASHADREPPRRPAISWGECGFWAAEPDVGRVAHGIPRAMEQLRAYGNAIVPQVAAEFIKASM